MRRSRKWRDNFAQACVALYERPLGTTRHGVRPDPRRVEVDRPEMPASCYWESLRVGDGSGARTVAFPAVSVAIYGWPMDDAARIRWRRQGRRRDRTRTAGSSSSTRARTRRSPRRSTDQDRGPFTHPVRVPCPTAPNALIHEVTLVTPTLMGLSDAGKGIGRHGPQRTRRTSRAVSATCSSVRCSPDSRSQSSIRSMVRRRW